MAWFHIISSSVPLHIPITEREPMRREKHGSGSLTCRWERRWGLVAWRLITTSLPFLKVTKRHFIKREKWRGKWDWKKEKGAKNWMEKLKGMEGMEGAKEEERWSCEPLGIFLFLFSFFSFFFFFSNSSFLSVQLVNNYNWRITWTNTWNPPSSHALSFNVRLLPFSYWAQRR